MDPGDIHHKRSNWGLFDGYSVVVLTRSWWWLGKEVRRDIVNAISVAKSVAGKQRNPISDPIKGYTSCACNGTALLGMPPCSKL